MKRFILLGMTLGATVLVLPMFAAFEAHVVNVTATVDNALDVPIGELTYGTVFPQQILDKTFDVSLSQSFLATSRVDDVNYFLRQKPKCWNGDAQNPKFGLVTETADNPNVFVCADQGYTQLPLLCPYLSKHEITTDGTSPAGENDGQGISSFHGTTVLADWKLDLAKSFDALGHLAKSQQDTSDTWDIDLHTPCFEGECAQDWAKFVTTANPSIPAEDASLWEAPQSAKGTLMGCDLWLEVSNISYPNIGCDEQLDLSIVLDRSGSIDSGELTSLKNAANSFVTALAPTAPGVHVGQISFNASASQDLNLSGVEADIHTAINNLPAPTGLTNLASGINLAQALYGISNTPPERVGVKNVMIIITDGNPTFPDEATGKTNAIAAANAAKADGTQIFVLGIGADVDGAFLANNIATDPAHYFAVAQFSDLQAALTGIAQCVQ